jgi:hypothetical protein
MTGLMFKLRENMKTARLIGVAVSRLVCLLWLREDPVDRLQ